ncbi:hypothetical protein BABINDRAFT_159457 [Babjeviella inositovora NRRL Y-12698]|uniref:MOSC domain-containing protein n=1 Tax=Babjeviella inositovora NRRL Y-12698 TaxID=984486 RepID=A0A1E3QZB7_9ASCO|nr:uncharacterized protein BABINDRAFT_159457 [Babjeviella inositovora NRRL Y-12698]ODQ82978.1 hypothetical protein BABINDRAFT_159457 [Babjeviella inositovora NRRL Y-12698]
MSQILVHIIVGLSLILSLAYLFQRLKKFDHTPWDSWAIRAINLLYRLKYSLLPQCIVVENGGTIAKIMVYPVKSLAPVYLDKCYIDEFGFKYDRMFMLGRWSETKAAFESITQRQCPRLSLCKVTLDQENEILTVFWPTKKEERNSSKSFTIPCIQSSKFKEYPVELWGVGFHTSIIDILPGEFIADMNLPSDTKLLFSENGKSVKSNSPGKEVIYNSSTSREFRSTRFQEYFPSLFLTEEDISDLNNRLNGLEFPFQATEVNFRGNVILSGTRKPYDSDTWSRIRIVNPRRVSHWHVTSKCPRCTIPNIDPSTGEMRDDSPVSKMLARYRRVDSGQRAYFFFGIHAIQLGEVGYELEVGDRIEVLSKRINVYEGLK